MGGINLTILGVCVGLAYAASAHAKLPNYSAASWCLQSLQHANSGSLEKRGLSDTTIISGKRVDPKSAEDLDDSLFTVLPGTNAGKKGLYVYASDGVYFKETGNILDKIQNSVEAKKGLDAETSANNKALLQILIKTARECEQVETQKKKKLEIELEGLDDDLADKKRQLIGLSNTKLKKCKKILNDSEELLKSMADTKAEIDRAMKMGIVFEVKLSTSKYLGTRCMSYGKTGSANLLEAVTFLGKTCDTAVILPVYFMDRVPTKEANSSLEVEILLAMSYINPKKSLSKEDREELIKGLKQECREISQLPQIKEVAERWLCKLGEDGFDSCVEKDSSGKPGVKPKPAPPITIKL